MMRVLDVILSLLGLIVTLPLLLVLVILGLFDTGSPIFRQVRVGRRQQPFTLWNFRTMRPDTLHVASHLADAVAITRWGRFLRRTKLDELPQLWNVLKGEMSLVGQRPCMLNQEELVAERAARGVFDVRPGITGLAQVQSIDKSISRLLAEIDADMIRSLSIRSYFKYIILTVLGKGSGDYVRENAQ